ncbi:hypothetical protein [Roseomonas sp. USHLN139]|uniref:hypothetical protein n=1 Tax=Roseomonas sp. USHLN139 TaxID=3081298 RepID=UPI003B0120F1
MAYVRLHDITQGEFFINSSKIILLAAHNGEEMQTYVKYGSEENDYAIVEGSPEEVIVKIEESDRHKSLGKP